MVARFAGVLVVMWFVSGCAQKLANYDYNTAVAFQGFNHYRIAKQEGVPYQSLDASRIEAAIKTALAGRYKFTEEGDSDFIVSYHLEEDRSLDRSGVSFGFGISSGNLGVGINTGPKAREVVAGRLVLSIIEVASDQVVWQAKATKSLKPDMKTDLRQSLIQELVAEMLSNFPPR